MNATIIMEQAEFFVRIIIAAICGAMIGYERKSRNKEAGIRTHLIVAAGAALIMIVSKYGFSDIITKHGIDLDPSRIAAQIVSGVGFLGAGMIFMRKNTISGLTTAAGIWATSAIGMTIGSGLYAIGIATSILLICGQVLLHSNHRWFHEYYKDEIKITIRKDMGALTEIKVQLEKYNIEIDTLKISEHEKDIQMEMVVIFPDNFTTVN